MVTRDSIEKFEEGMKNKKLKASAVHEGEKMM